MSTVEFYLRLANDSKPPTIRGSADKYLTDEFRIFRDPYNVGRFAIQFFGTTAWKDVRITWELSSLIPDRPLMVLTVVDDLELDQINMIKERLGQIFEGGRYHDKTIKLERQLPN